MKDDGLTNSPKKIELVFYGGTTVDICGNAFRPTGAPGQLIYRMGAVYINGSFKKDGQTYSCGSADAFFGTNFDLPGYFDFLGIHESLHAIGMVNECAPNYNPNSSGHVDDDKTDVMYTGPDPWSPAELDVGNDDYFDHDNADCLDLADSVFLDPLPDDAQVPPGWPANP